MQLTHCASIITGASQGLGFEIAKQFVLHGSDVMLCARNKDLLSQAQKTLLMLPERKSNVFAMSADISSLDQMNAFIDQALKQLGKIDILVANAGVNDTKGPVDEVDWESWSQTIDINLKGTVLSCRAVLPHFKKQRFGKIIILSGGGATKPMPFES